MLEKLKDLLEFIFIKTLDFVDLVILNLIKLLEVIKVKLDETLESKKLLSAKGGGRYTGTVTLDPNPVKFGEKCYFTYTTTYPDRVWAEVRVYSVDGTQALMAGYPRPWAGDTYFTAGPTPSWTSGPAVGVFKLLWHDGRRFRDIAGAEADFDVIA